MNRQVLEVINAIKGLNKNVYIDIGKAVAGMTSLHCSSQKILFTLNFLLFIPEITWFVLILNVPIQQFLFLLSIPSVGIKVVVFFNSSKYNENNGDVAVIVNNGGG